MIIIENKKTSINVTVNGAAPFEASYAQLIETFIVTQPKQNGYSKKDIQHRLAILKSVKDADGQINFNPSDYAYLKSLVENSKWDFVHEDIITFIDDISSGG